MCQYTRCRHCILPFLQIHQDRIIQNGRLAVLCAFRPRKSSNMVTRMTSQTNQGRQSVGNRKNRSNHLHSTSLSQLVFPSSSHHNTPCTAADFPHRKSLSIYSKAPRDPSCFEVCNCSCLYCCSSKFEKQCMFETRSCFLGSLHRYCCCCSC